MIEAIDKFLGLTQSEPLKQSPKQPFDSILKPGGVPWLGLVHTSYSRLITLSSSPSAPSKNIPVQ